MELSRLVHEMAEVPVAEEAPSWLSGVSALWERADEKAG